MELGVQSPKWEHSLSCMSTICYRETSLTWTIDFRDKEVSIYHSNHTNHPTTGKQFMHGERKPFRPTSGLTSYEKRAARDKETALVKAHEKELKDEKDAERQVSDSPLH